MVKQGFPLICSTTCRVPTMFFENVLRDFFGIGTHSRKELTEKVAHAATGLDFEMAIAAHENWKLRLQAFLEGTSTEVFASEQICFDDRCDLGKWIYSTGRAKLGSFPGFTALQGHHKMFHYAASNVVALPRRAKPMKPTKCWKCSLPSTRRKWCVTCNISAPWCARPGKTAPTPATEPLAPPGLHSRASCSCGVCASRWACAAARSTCPIA